LTERFKGRENFLGWYLGAFPKLSGTQGKSIFYNGSQVKTSKTCGTHGV
jgi:hypothetical protein